MNRSFVISILLITGNVCFGQDSCFKKRFEEVRRIIERAIPANDGYYAKKNSEFYIIDIKLDSTKNIETISCFKKDSSFHYRFVEDAISKVKSAWSFLDCDISRILIPLWILYDEPFDLPLKIESDQKEKTFVTKMIIAVVYPSMHKSINME